MVRFREAQRFGRSAPPPPETERVEREDHQGEPSSGVSFGRAAARRHHRVAPRPTGWLIALLVVVIDLIVWLR